MRNSLKITILQGAFLPVPPTRGGAVEKVWFALGKEFASRGHSVTHVSRSCELLPRSEIIEGVSHLRLKGGDPSRSQLLHQMRDFLYTVRAYSAIPQSDILITNTFWAPILLSPKRHGKIWVHIQRYPKGQMRLYRKAARLQTVSRVIADAIVDQNPECAARVLVIPNPLPTIARRELLSKRNPTLVLFVGRIHPEKGIEILLRAARISARKYPNIRFRIIGPHETHLGGGGNGYYDSLRNQGEQENIEWKSAIFDDSELSRHFSEASLFVYPSIADKGEASPVAPLEALASGCPVITSDLKCFDDLMGDGCYAQRFNHLSEEADNQLANLISTTLFDRQSWNRASAAAIERAKHFTVEKIADAYINEFITFQSEKTTNAK